MQQHLLQYGNNEAQKMQTVLFTQFFIGRMPRMVLSRQCQSTERNGTQSTNSIEGKILFDPPNDSWVGL